MPRSRNVRPSMYLDDRLGEASVEAHLLYIGLGMLADKSGRLLDRPKRIWAELVPYRADFDVESRLAELATIGAIRRYEVDGQRLIDLPRFSDEQSPHNTEKASTLPEFNSDTTVTPPLDNGASLIPDSCNRNLIPDSKKDCSEPDKPAAEPTSDPVALEIPCTGTGPKTYELRQSKVDEYRESFPGVDVLAECRKARQWTIDNATKRKTSRGVPAFLSRWLSRVQDSASNGGHRNGNAVGTGLNLKGFSDDEK